MQQAGTWEAKLIITSKKALYVFMINSTPLDANWTCWHVRNLAINNQFQTVVISRSTCIAYAENCFEMCINQHICAAKKKSAKTRRHFYDTQHCNFTSWLPHSCRKKSLYTLEHVIVNNVAKQLWLMLTVLRRCFNHLTCLREI